MTRSMTGFGSARGEVDGVSFTVEVRSVNSRYFKAVIKLPELLAGFESEVEKLLHSRLARGSVTVSVRMQFSGEQAAYRVNTEALSRYIEQLKAIEIDANPTMRIELGALLQLPGVCEAPSAEEISKKTRGVLLKLIEKAVNGLVEMREREGEALAADLLANAQAVDEGLKTVSERAPLVVQEYRDRLADRVQQLTDSGALQIDEDILAREVAIFAERCDVAEEITRLGGHVEQMRSILAQDKPNGRRLEFISQEMLREANTIGSKSSDTEIGRAVVEIKTAVDRIKEQVQNVE